MPVGISRLATATVDRLRDVQDRTLLVHGVAIHCTGSGLTTKALAAGADGLEYAVAYYLRPESYFAHYVIGFDGTIAQIANERERAPHIGLPEADRQAYLTGAWKDRLPRSFVDSWAARWPRHRSPSHLYPGRSPNNVYVGIELLVWIPGCPGAPHAAGMKYTTAQHHAAGELAKDIADRWKLPAGWQSSGRLACHEDISPLSRANKGGGWDPGVLRASRWFEWDDFVGRL